jgi:hypothetical protein
MHATLLVPLLLLIPSCHGLPSASRDCVQIDVRRSATGHGAAPGITSDRRPVPAVRRAIPLRFGFDDIGFTSPLPWHEASLTRHPRGAELMRDLGMSFWLMWYPDASLGWAYDKHVEFIRRVDAWCDANGMDWMPNTLSSLWNTSPERWINPQGYDWFCRPDGRRFFLYPTELLKEFGRSKRVLGVMYDEPEHHQNNANGIPGFDRPSIYDPAGAALVDAADGHTKAVGELVALHRRFGLRLYTEHVTPVMYHTFARAGCVAGTKVLKEAWSPAYVACALGASIQYQTPLWVTPDLWGLQGYPSHSPEEYRSALLLAYHLGADCIYTESLCLPPSAGAPYPVNSLAEVTDTDYKLTAFGDVARRFIKEYVPNHPRLFERRRLRPRVVIVRQEDGCYGQRTVAAPWLPDRLFGSKVWKSTPTTEAWLAIWSLLTRGAIPRDNLYRGWGAYANTPNRVLAPLDGVVVYDHHVGYDLLREAEVIFLTGVGVSKETQAAVAKCVRGGATCVSLPGLAPRTVRGRSGAAGACTDGRGRWVLTDDFLSPAVRKAVAHVIPTEDMIRYRFGDQTITLRPVGGDLRRITAEIQTEPR